jgi:hypothetical protein
MHELSSRWKKIPSFLNREARFHFTNWYAVLLSCKLLACNFFMHGGALKYEQTWMGGSSSEESTPVYYHTNALKRYAMNVFAFHL